jgi:predicted O-methyltransferase YrrM
MELKYTKDKFGNDILCNEDESHQIMMEWEKPYMEKSIEILNPFGKVLEIGFGMGYSARKICSFKNVSEYYVIECSPAVWEVFDKFKEEQNKVRNDLVIKLIKGRWQDMLSTIDIYDCIYFDDYILDEDPLAHLNSYTRFNTFLYNVLKSHTKKGSRISCYSGSKNYEIFNTVNCISINVTEYPIEIPKNCNYARGDKMYIPIFTKIAEADDDIKDKLLGFKKELTQTSEINENFKKEIQRKKKYKKLFDDIQIRSPSCGLIVIDNFYNNAYETRNYVLTQEFLVRGNYPGQRTISYANNHLKDIIQKYVEPFGGKITDFPIPKEDGSDAAKIYNGSFQFTTSRDRSWVHIDGFNNWAGVLYLTPNAPLSSGTSFYNFYDGTTCKRDMEILENKEETDKYSQDMTKWKKVDQVGNVFNRLILFNSNRFHMSMDYFGDSKENGRLFQVFFFSTER